MTFVPRFYGCLGQSVRQGKHSCPTESYRARLLCDSHRTSLTGNIPADCLQSTPTTAPFPIVRQQQRQRALQAVTGYCELAACRGDGSYATSVFSGTTRPLHRSRTGVHPYRPVLEQNPCMMLPTRGYLWRRMDLNHRTRPRVPRTTSYALLRHMV